MKTRPFLIATSVSTVLQTLYYIVLGAVTLLIFPRMMDSMLQDLPSNGGPPPGVFNFMSISFFLTCIGLILGPIAHAGTGALYAWLHRREEPPVTSEQGALGGGAAAFTARFATGLLVALGSLLLSNLMMGAMADVFSTPGAGVPPDFPPMFTVINSVSSVFGGLVSACFGSIVAALLGSLGGALTGAILK